jgi:hypothetical protein
MSTPGWDKPATPRQMRPSASTTAAEAPRSGTARTALSSVRCIRAIHVVSTATVGGEGIEVSTVVGADDVQAIGPVLAHTISTPITAIKRRAGIREYSA